ncbi:hypothetical protein NQ314_020286 [Rhamnusium bicolor]|uniref:Amine oxidase domain-containing protein n=1 Tax=Rhamnusium bicolor TaxID=1586634 RepID=A0AAV8WLL9_9CUCU|nr:hypothetical protein NQ314_020286 [Rhamnusium bicolor]
MVVKTLVFLCFNLFFSIYCIRDSPSVVVVGAGPSGIAAATKLLKHNFTNVIVLEAEDRIGGRIRSIKFGDAYVDLGAEWCHGEKDNIVYSMINKYNILKHTNLSNKLIYSNGKYIEDDIYKALIDFAESIDASQTNPITEASCKQFLSIGECFVKR